MAERASASDEARPQERPTGPPPTWRIGLGVVSLLAGVAILAWPGRSVALVAAVAGAVLVLTGVVAIALAATRRDVDGGSRTWSAILGVLYLVVGAVCLTRPVLTAVLLSLALGCAWIAGGAASVYEAVTGTYDRLGNGIDGVIGILIGVVVLVWPLASAVALAYVVGGALVVLGLVAVIRGVSIRRRRA